MHEQLMTGPSGARPTEPRSGRPRRLAVLLVVACTLLGAGAGLWWGLQQQSVHRASAVVLVNPLEGNPFSPDGRGDELVNLETEAQLVRSDTMGDLVGRALDEDSRTLLGDLSVSVPPNTQLLEITAEGATADRAGLRAQAFAETYLAFRRTRTESARFDRAAELEERIRDREAEHAALSEQLDKATPRSSQAAVLTQQIVNLSVQADELRAQLGATQGLNPDPGQIVTPAVAARSGLPGGLVTAALLGALAGAALGWVGGSGLGRDGTPGEDPGARAVGPGGRAPGAPARAWPVPPLGALPPAAPASAMATVRAALLAAERARPLTALVCHPADAFGSVAAIGLARSMAAARLRTVLVDVSRPLGPPGRGLADVLRGDVPLGDVLLGEGPHLRMVGAGTRAADLDDVLAGPAAERLLAELRADADVVLIGGGAVGDPRTLALVAAVDTVLLEACADTADTADPAAAFELLRRVGARSVRLLLVDGPAPTTVTGAAPTPEAATTGATTGATPATKDGAVTPSERQHARPRWRLRLTRWVVGRPPPATEPALSGGGSVHRGSGGAG
ncbi:hypothetical protein [Nocardioides deserti]|uniref:Polysaccharide chain length determinant N-terminal domain-containing protein n=1 Tax=Nocardioides deserti TaxID=1588644 RepID=A0ABR6U7Q0_9ACTN|nr:hypothetical protein [Nocardioides deserti]MBC2959994.1 hypothetical protein [Nocardioides deserti]GGO75245.1 hypothetical protein GCM10012276_25140 [Nocardioides deserti]